MSRRRATLPRYPSVILDEVNRMERATDPLAVATAALMHRAYTGGVTPGVDGFDDEASRLREALLTGWSLRVLVDYQQCNVDYYRTSAVVDSIETVEEGP
jgi:hypothetical protein